LNWMNQGSYAGSSRIVRTDVYLKRRNGGEQEGWMGGGRGALIRLLRLHAFPFLYSLPYHSVYHSVIARSYHSAAPHQGDA
jgi:hypothetical protein